MIPKASTWRVLSALGGSWEPLVDYRKPLKTVGNLLVWPPGASHGPPRRLPKLPGGLLEPLGSLLEPLGSLLEPLGSLLKPLGSLLEPLGSLLVTENP